jgi:hypothetical protein
MNAGAPAKPAATPAATPAPAKPAPPAPEPARPPRSAPVPGEYLYALTSAEDLAARQRAADAAAADAARRSGLAGLTLRTAWEDLREFLVGVPADLTAATGRRVPLGELLCRNDRLRGLGVALVLAALLGLAL